MIPTFLIFATTVRYMRISRTKDIIKPPSDSTFSLFFNRSLFFCPFFAARLLVRLFTAMRYGSGPILLPVLQRFIKIINETK